MAFYNARTMGYIPPTPDDVLDIDDDDVQAVYDEFHGVVRVVAEPVDAEPMDVEPEDAEADDVEDDDADAEAADPGQVPDLPEIDPEEEDKLILDGIQNADADNQVHSLEDLVNYIEAQNLNLRLRRPIRKDGNCLFDSLVDLIEKFDIKTVPRDHNLLRQAICSSFTRHPQFPTWMANHFKRPVVFQMYLENMKKNGIYSDNMGLIVAVAAHFIGNSVNLWMTFTVIQLS